MYVDTNGAAYVTGMAAAGYPTTTGAYQTSIAAGDTYNVFVSKLSGDGTSLAYSTFFGAVDSNIVSNETIAVDPLGQAIIVGSANQPPTTPGALCGDPVPPPVADKRICDKVQCFRVGSHLFDNTLRQRHRRRKRGCCRQFGRRLRHGL